MQGIYGDYRHHIRKMDLRPRKFGKVACLGDENFVRHIRRYGSQNFR